MLIRPRCREFVFQFQFVRIWRLSWYFWVLSWKIIHIEYRRLRTTAYEYHMLRIRYYYFSALRTEPATLLFLREPRSWALLIFVFFQASFSRSAANNSFNIYNYFAVDFLDFMMSNPTKTSPKAIKIRLKIGLEAVPGALGGDFHFGSRMAQGSKMAPKNCEQLVLSWYKNRDSDQVFVVLFFTVCEGALFVGFGCM